MADKFGQDMSFRFGGDEFLAIALDEPLDISLGFKQEKADHVNISDLLYRADKAMRKSKEEFYKKAENDHRAR